MNLNKDFFKNSCQDTEKTDKINDQNDYEALRKIC